tara:strand:+ start:400 stop:1095 length:696 start_codon:yes stop_codon:yes gene_type:complete
MAQFKFGKGGKEASNRLKERSAVGEDVYDVLLAQIMSLEIAPREKVSVDALARELGVSQTPIRAALIRLEADGLVIKRHNVGYTAAPLPSVKGFQEIYKMRSLLEPEAVRMATSRMTPEDMVALEKIQRKMTDLDAEGTLKGYSMFARLDAEFHEKIATIASNSLIANTLERLFTHVHLFRSRRNSAVTRDAIAEHEALLDAMRASEPEKAAEAMRVHVVNSERRIIPFLD